MIKYYALVGLMVFLLAGFLIPIDSYTTTKWTCGGVEPKTERLHLIFGDSLNEIKTQDESSDDELSPFAGCSMPVKYTLYLL